MRTINVFLASSEELRHERLLVPAIILDMNRELRKSGLRLDLVKWEYLDSAMGVLHKQTEYDLELAKCEIVITLFWRKFGQYTEEEFHVAMNRLRAGRNPRRVAVLFKKSGEGVSEALEAFEQTLSEERGLSVGSFASDGELEENVRSVVSGFLNMTLR